MAEQTRKICVGNVQSANGISVPVKRAREGKFSVKAIFISNRRPRLIIQINIRRQHDGLAGKVVSIVYQFRQSRQLLCGADLIDSLSVGFNRRYGRTVPRICSSIQRYAQQGILLDIIDVAVVCIFFVCNYLVIFAGSFILIIRLGGLFVLAVLGVLVLIVLAVLAGVSVSRVRVALDDGRTAAAHHLRGKGRGGHQRQREHHAHQQAHDAPGHTACPFLHVICLLSLLNVSV